MAVKKKYIIKGFIKKSNQWILKNFSIITVIFIILLAPLYIIYFGEYLNEKTAEILIAVAAIVSTIFLFLAFRESKISNEIKIYETDYNLLEKEVTAKEIKAKEEVFFYKISEIVTILNYPEANLKEITFKNFYLDIYGLFKHIEGENSYNKCLLLLNNSDKVTLVSVDVEEAQKLSEALTAVHLNINCLIHYYVGLMLLFNSIEKSPKRAENIII